MSTTSSYRVDIKQGDRPTRSIYVEGDRALRALLDFYGQWVVGIYEG